VGLCRSNAVDLEKLGNVLFKFSDALLRNWFASLKPAFVRKKSVMNVIGQAAGKVYLYKFTSQPSLKKICWYWVRCPIY
jgi:hypothetical protein